MATCMYMFIANFQLWNLLFRNWSYFLESILRSFLNYSVSMAHQLASNEWDEGLLHFVYQKPRDLFFDSSTRQQHYWDIVSLFRNVHNVHFSKIQQLLASRLIKVNKNISIMFFTKSAFCKLAFVIHTSWQIMSSPYLKFPELLSFFFFSFYTMQGTQ